jgi:zinc and cadmium transporter
MDLEIVLSSFGAVLIVSLISFIGVFTLSLKKDQLERILYLLVSLAAGTMIGDAFIHLIPESLESFENEHSVFLGVIAGILLFYVLENIIQWRHCHIQPSEEHKHPLALSNLIGDGVHNFTDGLIIGGSFFAGVEIGILTTITIILHELPQEIGDFGVLIYSGIKRKKALFYNFLSALIALLGVTVSLILGTQSESLVIYILPFAAGGFIYIAVADLIPELRHGCENWKRSVLKFLAILLGIGVMFLFTLFE